MESIAPVLTKLAFEIACFQILEDLLDILKAQENSDDVAMLSLIDLDFEDQSIEIYLLTKLVEIEDEAELMSKVIEVINVLSSTPGSVLRPYQQPFITPTYVYYRLLFFSPIY